ncbi:helix-turn-helix domain-containing protein [Kitasatospora acidiphila]|uniref:Helix-turn-helix domain-containing protein n=1 Tax=Kitasatospora acidiphila TaxID=2567942 RepID=A0A540W634_9ACTN|nr:helix-turn-helix transcriptional regulator [Kitasatospora acidiphila]TQF04479.1 helix-turn-helix domain-containing protein [Kitasatospora acidiphila]
MNIKRLNPGASPRAAFGDQLRRSRLEKGWTQVEAGLHLGCTGAHVSGVETASKLPGRLFAVRADEVFSTGLLFQILWQAIKGRSFLEGFPEYLAEEAKAVEVRMFELDVIPGPLQTPEYAAAIAKADVARGIIDETQAKERLALLAARRRRLIQSPAGPYFYAVLNEGCLRRVVGGPAVMVRQLDALEQASASPRITIQVAPFALGEHRPFVLPISLLSLPDRSLIGYTESEGQATLVRDAATLATWDRAYHHLQVGALSELASLDKIRAAREENR